MREDPRTCSEFVVSQLAQFVDEFWELSDAIPDELKSWMLHHLDHLSRETVPLWARLSEATATKEDIDGIWRAGTPAYLALARRYQQTFIEKHDPDTEQQQRRVQRSSEYILLKYVDAYVHDCFEALNEPRSSGARTKLYAIQQQYQLKHPIISRYEMMLDGVSMNEIDWEEFCSIARTLLRSLHKAVYRPKHLDKGSLNTATPW